MFLKEKYWHRLFEATVFIKAINGFWETISGFALILISKTTLDNTFIALTRKELIEDPQDKLISLLNTQLQHLTTSTKDFAAIYILAHGILNVFLAYHLFKDRLWAYLVSIAFAVMLTPYLIYRVSHTHSNILIGAIVFDILFTILTWHEFKYQKRLQQTNTKRAY